MRVRLDFLFFAIVSFTDAFLFSNCVRRGRECVYPPRVPRVPRRRRKAATAAPAPAAAQNQPSQYPVLSINTQFLQ